MRLRRDADLLEVEDDSAVAFDLDVDELDGVRRTYPVVGDESPYSQWGQQGQAYVITIPPISPKITTLHRRSFSPLGFVGEVCVLE